MNKFIGILGSLFLLLPMTVQADPPSKTASPVATSAPSPEPITRVVIQDVASKSQPMTIYRSGFIYARDEKARPAPQGGHRVMIYSVPDFWEIDLEAKTAQHSVDPDGDKGEMHMPIWTEGSMTEIPTLKGLEFGTEFEFLKKNKVVPSGSKTVQGTLCDQYVFKGGDFTVTIWAKKGTEIPVQTEIDKGSKKVDSTTYLSYETGLPFNKDLFLVPADIKVVEAPITESKIDWKEFRPEGGRFSIQMPGAWEVDPTDKTLWSAQDPTGRAYVVSYADVPQKDVKAEDFFDSTLDIALKNLKGQLVDQKIFQYKGFTAGEFKILAGKNQIGMARMVMVNQRVYSLEYWASAEIFNTEPMHKFFDSLQIFDPDKDKVK